MAESRIPEHDRSALSRALSSGIMSCNLLMVRRGQSCAQQFLRMRCRFAEDRLSRSLFTHKLYAYGIDLTGLGPA